MLNVFVRNYLIFTAILLACVLFLGYILISGERKIDKSDDQVIHSHTVILEVEQFSTLISRMLSAQRGYIVTQDESFMQEYEDRKANASRTLATISELTADNPSQQSRLQEIRQYFTEFSDQLEARAERSVKDSVQVVLKDVDSIDRLSSNIFRLNEDLLEEEQQLLSERIKSVERKKNQYYLTLLIGGGVAVILLMLFNAYLLRVQSKRSAAEIALDQQEQVFRLAVEGTQDGVFDWDIKTGKAFFSEQYISMLGCVQEDFEGTVEDFSKRLHPEEKDKIWDYAQLYLEGKLSEYSNTFRMQHKSGRWIWVNARAKVIRDKHGKAIRMVGAHTDVSAAKDYEQQLEDAKTKAEEANRAKSDFLAHMSHEIRTPLTTISGASEILLESKDSFDEKRQTLISVLHTSATTLKNIITDVLDFSKIESGEMDLEESVFALNQTLEHIISIMSVKAGENKLDFRFDFNDVKDLQFYGDPVRLQQILINLINNALKFTEKGHVHVTAKREEKDGEALLRIDVEDTGIGLKKEQFDLIFERFKQADSSVSRKYGGTGLGLPISKNLAHLMGGDIFVESTHGKGSTFSLVLPLRISEGTEEMREEDQARQQKINDRLKSIVTDTHKVLLVEDYEGNIVVLGYILESMNVNYDVAKTGLEAVNMWKECHYDLVLMDIQMPEMDGFTATRHIRQIESEQNLDSTPIIGMTAHALVGDKDKCIECGMDAYLPKPIVETDLKAAILKFLNRTKNEAA